MQEIIVESYPKINEDEKDFPNLQNPKFNLKYIENLKRFPAYP